MSARDDLERNTDRTLGVLTDSGLMPDQVLTENDAVLSWARTPVYVVVYDDTLTRNVHAFNGADALWDVNVWDLVDRADGLVSMLRSAIAAARSAA